MRHTAPDGGPAEPAEPALGTLRSGVARWAARHADPVGPAATRAGQRWSSGGAA